MSQFIPVIKDAKMEIELFYLSKTPHQQFEPFQKLGYSHRESFQIPNNNP